MTQFPNFNLVDHPLIQHKLTIIRNKETGSKEMRELLDEITLLIGYEATRDFPTEDTQIQTPIQSYTGKQLAGKKPVIVPILRAGLGMLNGLVGLLPAAKVGHIGLARNEETHLPEVYYCKLPESLDQRLIILCDPMLATGGSAGDAIDLLKAKGATTIRMVALLASPEGVKALGERHPDVQIYCGALDEKLNDKAYIVPGLGDAGDRLYGTF